MNDTDPPDEDTTDATVLEDEDGSILAVDFGDELRLTVVPTTSDLPDLTGAPVLAAAAGRPIRVKVAVEPDLYRWDGGTWVSERVRSDAEIAALAWARDRAARASRTAALTDD